MKVSMVSLLQNFLLAAKARRQKIRRLQASRTKQVQGLESFTRVQKRSNEASLKICSLLGEAMAPYSYGPLVKQCIQAACMTIFLGNMEVNQAVGHQTLSGKTVTSRIENISNHVFEKLIYNPKGKGYSFAIDESTDNEDMAQLLVFLRFCRQESSNFIEQLLTMLPLEEHTTVESTWLLLTACNKKRLPLEKLISDSTNGAPAMSGNVGGLAGRLKRPWQNYVLSLYHKSGSNVLQTVRWSGCCYLKRNIKAQQDIFTKAIESDTEVKS